MRIRDGGWNHQAPQYYGPAPDAAQQQKCTCNEARIRQRPLLFRHAQGKGWRGGVQEKEIIVNAS